MLLQTSTRKFGDALIVDCSGKIVIGDETAHLRETVKDLLNKSSKIVLNLGNVNYIDSSGVGTLVGLYASAHSKGAIIKLAALTGRVKDVLQITKLATVFESYTTAEEAASSFVQGAGKATASEFAG